VLLCGSAEASLLVYEPFDYPATGGPDSDSDGDGKTDLRLLPPGGLSLGLNSTGWRQGEEFKWTYEVQEGNIPGVGSTAALPSTGNRMRTSLRTVDSGDPTPVNSRDNYIEFSQDLAATEYPVLWFSVLIDTVAIGPLDAAFYSDRFFFKLESADRSSGVVIGHGGELGANWLAAGLPASGDPTVAEMDLPVTAGELNYFVGKLTFATGGEGTRIDLWANPLAGATPPTSDPYTVYVPGLAELGSVMFDIQGQSTQVNDIDEIRIGTEWLDIAVPEPGTAATLCVSAGLLALRRRRRA
jgi:hypothetical protein